MKLDQEDAEFFQRRSRKETPHGLIAFILASIVVSACLYVLYQNKNSRPLNQPESPISKVEQPSNTLRHPQQPSHDTQQTYQSKPEPAYAQRSAKTTVFKCKQPDGSILYSESACSAGATTQIVTVKENVIESSALRNKANQMQAMAVRNDAETLRVSEVRYMSEVEVWKRIKELEMDMRSITVSQEKMSAARIEVNILKNRRVRQLSYDDENERSGLRGLLNSQDIEVRKTSLIKLTNLYKNY